MDSIEFPFRFQNKKRSYFKTNMCTHTQMYTTYENTSYGCVSLSLTLSTVSLSAIILTHENEIEKHKTY